jgi:2-(3-amino-3-carboxypropyl)histidine synthase
MEKYPHYFTWNPIDNSTVKSSEIKRESLNPYLKQILECIKPTDNVIGIQIPEGLKPEIFDLVEQINKALPEIKVITFYEPCFGSCDIVESNYDFVDRIFHFGNSGMPYVKSNKTIFLEMHYEAGKLDIELILKKANKIGKKIGIAYNVQFYNYSLELEKALLENGFEPVKAKSGGRIKHDGQILGCNYTSMSNIDSFVDGYIVITHGDFHPEIIPLITNKKVLIVDVIDKKVKWIKDTKENFISKRRKVLEECKNAKKFGIIVSSKAGQNRINDAYALLDEMKKKGKKGYLLMGNYMFSQYFKNFEVDAYIDLACPRLAINNGRKFDKPFITLTEARELLNGGEYKFDTFY